MGEQVNARSWIERKDEGRAWMGRILKESNGQEVPG